MKPRHFLFFIALILIVILAYNQFSQVQSFSQLLRDVHWWVLLFVIPLRYLYYWSNAQYYKSFFSIFKKSTPNTKLLESVITMNFVNIVFPSGGISGLSYIRKALDGDVDSSDVTLGQLSWYVLSFICYIGLLALSFVILLLSNQVIQISSRIILLVILVLLSISVAALVFIFSPKFVESVALTAIKPVNKFLHLLRARILARARVKNFLTQLHSSILFLKRNSKEIFKLPLLYTFLMVIWDMLTIFVVFVAFGEVVNPAIIVAAYVIALISSVAAVITAGVGVYEAAMVATFVGFHIPFDVAFAVTIVYRIVSLWLFMPVGLVFYKKTLLDKKPSKQKK